jgi:predicted CoA-binding protein
LCRAVRAGGGGRGWIPRGAGRCCAHEDAPARDRAVPRAGLVRGGRRLDKYGNKVLRCYLQHGLPAVAVNPKQSSVEGVPSYPSLREVPATVRAASVVAPPAAALRIVEDAQARGIAHLWFQPGAEDAAATAAAARAGIAVIAGEPCLLVALGFRDA